MRDACIVGMCNPLSEDPDDAMEPYTPNGSGERLWKMVNLVVPCSKERYCDTFHLLNIVPGTQWRVEKVYVDRVKAKVAGKQAAVLGVAAWAALVDETPVRKTDWFGSSSNWTLFPHPSGLCRVYNSDEMRRKAGEILARMGGLI